MKNILKNILKNKDLLLFMLIFVLAAVFYLFKLGYSDLWSDEIYTKAMLQGSLSDFYDNFRNDLHPPLYYLGLRLFTSLFGLSALTMRLFSVLGVLSILLLGYFAGQRIFGRRGALYFCLMLISLPMLAAYSHQARMYTWAAFTVTGLFIYAYLYMKTGSRRDLIFLFVFTLAAIYMHYYSMLAAFVTNAFVFFYLLLTKNKKWIPHLLSVLLALVLFIPWLFMFIVQVKKVQHAFWAPDVNLNGILSCFTIPFTEQFWLSPFSRVLTVLMYCLIVVSLILSFKKSFSEYRLVMYLSLTVFVGTIMLVSLISLVSQPILSTRYVMTIVTMLAVPPAILIIQMRMRWLKILLPLLILSLGVRISISNFGFSYGPYQRTIDYISNTYPEIKKVLHITEVTAGPLVEYTGNTGLDHYWLKAEMSNVDAFKEVHQFDRPGEFLHPGEEFCVVRFHSLDLNIENLDLVLSESELIKKDTVWDPKFENGIYLQLYILKYAGGSQE